MNCPKCRGLLVAERYLDFYGPVARWKRINCGWSRTEHQHAQALVERALSCRSRKPAPSFRAPALVAGTLTYLGSTQFAGRWTALCFLPYVGIVEPDFIDHQADNLDRIDTELLIVSSDTRPLHRVWLDRPTTLRTPLLYDPLGSLHRSFGVPPAQIPVRCQTFLIDRADLLRFHLIHDFTDHGLSALQEIVTLSQSQDTGGVAATDTIADAREEVMNS